MATNPIVGGDASRRLDRLFRPRSVAVIGGGAWGAHVARGCRAMGFDGPVWAVHPSKETVGGAPAYRSISELPGAPDAAFIGVNRQASVDAARALAARGAGGAVCFASGFAEAVVEDPSAPSLQAALLEAAGEMPVLGPNCYGFVNALDGVALWPDGHGLARVDRGVAIVSQSSNVALNLTMQRRGLPIAHMATVGNQAQLTAVRIAEALLEDPRVTAVGLYLESVADLRGAEALARAARAYGKPIVVLKVGVSANGRAAAVSHTAALTGEDAGAQALFERLGIGRVDTPAALIESLKLLHAYGPLPDRRIASLSCSGGEATLVADMATAAGLTCPPLTAAQRGRLRDALGPKVALGNPLDYHTYIWGDRPAMAQCFAAMAAPHLALTCVILDFPRTDRCDIGPWELVVDAVADAQTATGAPMAVVSSLPDTLPEAAALAMAARGIAPLAGLAEALEAARAAADIGAAWARPPAEPALAAAPDPGRRRDATCALRLLSEDAAKSLLADYGLDAPRRVRAASPSDAAAAAEEIGLPVALKGEGAAHKSEAGLVALGLASAADVAARAKAMPADAFLVEEMIAGGVAELLLGVRRDPPHGVTLTLGAGGIWTELLGDSVTLLIPSGPDAIAEALSRLRIAPLLDGYRRAPPASLDAILKAVAAAQTAAIALQDDLEEIEINPLICTPTRAVAADALIRLRATPEEPA